MSTKNKTHMNNTEMIPYLMDHFDAAFDEKTNKHKRLIEQLQLGDERYDGQNTINEGGMKYIIQTFDELTKRSIAKAVIKNGSDPETVQNFIREARITAGLEHPNIVPVHDIGLENQNEPFFTMKLLHGENLQDIINKLKAKDPEYQKNYSSVELLNIFLKICDAVAFAHSKHVLHLDLKPANIQVNEFGEVLLCDWGLARQLVDIQKENLQDLEFQKPKTSSIDLTQDGILKGSPGFMAPEQISRSAGTRTYTTDVYSLGAILYSILTLEYSIEKNTLKEMVKQTLSGEITPPINRSPCREISKSLNAVTVKAMALEPDNRYQSVNELSREVKSFLQGYATEAEHATFLTILKLLFKRHKELCIMILGFFIIIISITWVFMSSLRNEREAALTSERMARKSQALEKDARQKAEHAQFKAEAADRLSLEIRKQTAVYLLNFSKKEYQKASYQHALELIEKSILSDPENMEARFYYALYLFGFHKFSECIAELDKYQGPLKTTWLRDYALLAKKERFEDFINSDTFADILKDMKNLKKNQKLRHHFLLQATYIYPEEKRWEFAKSHLKEMCVTKFKFDLKKKIDQTYILSIAGNKGVYDLTALNNLPISELDASNTDIGDIIATEKMPLEKINISHTHVYSIQALEGKTIRNINIWMTNVRNLKYISQAPLEIIHLNNKWSDLNYLVDIAELEKVYLSRFTFNEINLKKITDKRQGDLELIFVD